MTSLYSRSSIARVATVVRLLKTGRHTMPSIARELECHPKTITRDMDLLRDRFNMPATYDSSAHRWQLPKDWRFELQ